MVKLGWLEWRFARIPCIIYRLCQADLVRLESQTARSTGMYCEIKWTYNSVRFPPNMLFCFPVQSKLTTSTTWHENWSQLTIRKMSDKPWMKLLNLKRLPGTKTQVSESFTSMLQSFVLLLQPPVMMGELIEISEEFKLTGTDLCWTIFVLCHHGTTTSKSLQAVILVFSTLSTVSEVLVHFQLREFSPLLDQFQKLIFLVHTCPITMAERLPCLQVAWSWFWVLVFKVDLNHSACLWEVDSWWVLETPWLNFLHHFSSLNFAIHNIVERLQPSTTVSGTWVPSSTLGCLSEHDELTATGHGEFQLLVKVFHQSFN